MLGFGKSPAQKERDRLLADLSARYREALRRYFYRRVQNHAEAEDLTQELFVRIVRKADIGQVENPEAFLFQAAVNLLRDRSRRYKTSNAFLAEINASADEMFEDLSPERVLDSKQSLQQALRVLNSLDARTRDVFILHRLEGMKHAEIAQLYGISVSSVEKYIMKCLVLLAKHAPGKDL